MHISVLQVEETSGYPGQLDVFDPPYYLSPLKSPNAAIVPSTRSKPIVSGERL